MMHTCVRLIDARAKVSRIAMIEKQVECQVSEADPELCERDEKDSEKMEKIYNY